MRVVCLADVSVGPGELTYRDDGEGPGPRGERRALAPADATACAFALALKTRMPDTTVEVVALGPTGALPVLEDLLRLGVDRLTLLSDRVFAGSDSLARGRILAAYLRDVPFDCLLTGARDIDGAPSEVPPQLAELLALPQLPDVVGVDEASLAEGCPLVDVDDGRERVTYRVRLPAVLSMKHDRRHELAHVRLRDSKTDVGDRLRVLGSHQLGLAAARVGIAGSPTRVADLPEPPVRRRERLIVRCDDDGIEQVHAFLQSRGLV